MIENRERFCSFTEVRVLAKEILSCSRDLVDIDDSKIDEVLLPRIERFLNSRNEGVWLPEGSNLSLENECGLNLFLNVVNFCYKNPDTGHEYFYTSCDEKRIPRATGILAAMSRSGVRWDDFASVSELSVEKWREITQISNDNNLFLGDERGERVAGLAKYLLSENCPNIAKFLSLCNYGVIEMNSMLINSGYFEDKFMKRSQLACRMINEVLVRRDNTPLSDIKRLTVMADYRIPQVFYNLGVVNVSNHGLSLRIQNEIPIQANSREEDALRATAVVLGEEVAKRLSISESEADGILWGLSQAMAKMGEMIIPHMLVATDAY